MFKEGSNMRRLFVALVTSVLGALVLASGVVSLSASGVQAQGAIRRAPAPGGQPPIAISPEAARQRPRIAPPMVPPILLVDVGATLTVCILEGGGCSGDMATVYKQKAASIAVDAKTKVRKLYWSTTSPAVTGGLVQISPVPFKNAWPAPPGTFSRWVEKQSFSLDFDGAFGNDRIEKLTAVGMVNADYQVQAARNAAPLNRSAVRPAPAARPRPPEPAVLSRLSARLNLNIAGFVYQPTWYVRVVPLKGTAIAGRFTDEVVVKVVPPVKQDAFKFFVPAKTHEVRIKSFQPPRSPDKGVCSHAMILDTDYTYLAGLGKKTLKAGDRLCPQPYKGMGEQAWYEQLWNAVKGGLNWASQAYNSLKSAVVNAVGSVVCSGSDTCKAMLSAGLDIGLAALGVPPSIPNFDQLVDGGFDYLAGELAAQAGCPDVACKNLVKAGLKTALEQTKNTNPSCAGAAEAHDMGIEPLCLPPGVKAHLDPAGTYRDAQVVLEVKRNYLDGPAGTTYHLYWSNYGFNAGPVGGLIPNIEPYGKTLQITAPLEGPVFASENIRIPPLEKGQTIEIPINLVPSDYWVPGHKELMGGWSTVTFKDGWPQYQYNDWWMLYYGASLAMSASIDACPATLGYTSSCIISSDAKSVTLPMTLQLQ
jgi:hypothetical protein